MIISKTFRTKNKTQLKTSKNSEIKKISTMTTDNNDRTETKPQLSPTKRSRGRSRTKPESPLPRKKTPPTLESIFKKIIKFMNLQARLYLEQADAFLMCSTTQYQFIPSFMTQLETKYRKYDFPTAYLWFRLDVYDKIKDIYVYMSYEEIDIYCESIWNGNIDWPEDCCSKDYYEKQASNFEKNCKIRKVPNGKITAFILYIDEEIKRLLREDEVYQEMSDIKLRKIGSKKWKEMTLKQKQVYQDKADYLNGYWKYEGDDEKGKDKRKKDSKMERWGNKRCKIRVKVSGEVIGRKEVEKDLLKKYKANQD